MLSLHLALLRSLTCFDFSLQFYFNGFNNQVGSPSFTIDDGAQPPLVLASKDRNTIAATFSCFLLQRIGNNFMMVLFDVPLAGTFLAVAFFCFQLRWIGNVTVLFDFLFGVTILYCLGVVFCCCFSWKFALLSGGKPAALELFHLAYQFFFLTLVEFLQNAVRAVFFFFIGSLTCTLLSHINAGTRV